MSSPHLCSLKVSSIMLHFSAPFFSGLQFLCKGDSYGILIFALNWMLIFLFCFYNCHAQHHNIWVLCCHVDGSENMPYFFLAFDLSITLLSIGAITCGHKAVVCSVSLIASGKMTTFFRVLNEGNTENRCVAGLFMIVLLFYHHKLFGFSSLLFSYI